MSHFGEPQIRVFYLRTVEAGSLIAKVTQVHSLSFQHAQRHVRFEQKTGPLVQKNIEDSLINKLHITRR